MMSLSSSPSPFKLDEVVLLEREHITLSLSPIFFWRRPHHVVSEDENPTIREICVDA